ncbi:hypothetical protein R5R35_011087 [Gryllus longicercus]|uniref:U3 small nucleolar RNA-associated protein 15 homolog n=1 Tax=Gryllus longicercus TaxID=2509291 RepID=A0AAN9VRM5_9ORTH
MPPFKKTNVNIYSKPGPQVTPDTIYWKKFSPPVLLKEFGAIDYINFSPVQPYYFALTCSVRVQVYNPVTKQVYKNLSRFREAAYGAAFRSDGQLLCVGGEEGHIKLFEIKNKTLLRVFKGHRGPVHRCFFTSDKTHIASFSDDKTVSLWDIPSEKRITSFTEHTDYVRGGTVSPVSSDIVLSGAYDSAVCMYDSRMKVTALKVDHGAPVECVMFLPSGGIFLSAGGTEVRVWDALAGGRLLAKLSQHHKTVTCLHLASDNKRIMSGSLDRHVKIYDVASYKVVHTLDYPNSILSLGVSPGDETIAVGMVDGLVSITQKEKGQKPPKQERRVSYRYIPDNFQPAEVDEVVEQEEFEAMSKFDQYFRKFEYSKALDSVLSIYVTKKHPARTVAVFRELMKRKGLQNALAGREGKSLAVILRFLIKYLGDYRFTEILINVADILLDVYEDSPLVTTDLTVSQLLKRLTQRVHEEEHLSESLANLQGCLSMLLAGASSVDSSVPDPASIFPSVDAQKTTVIEVKDVR